MLENIPSLFGEPIPPYFALLILGFGAATYFGVRFALQMRLDKEVVIDLGLYALIAGVAGGRILHVLADGYFWDYVHLCTDPTQVIWKITRAECIDAEGLWDTARNICQPKERDCFAWAAFWRGGLTYYGGLISGVVFGVWFLRKEKFPVLRGMDMAGLIVPIGLFFGRIGCFLGGCCFGLETHGVFGLSFPAWSAASEKQFRDGSLATPGLPSLPVHPTQLYEALGCLLLSAVLAFYFHPRKRFDGQIFVGFIAGYSLLRFLLEFIRDDDRGGVLGLSTSQLISLAAVALCVPFWRYARRLSAQVAVPSAHGS